MSDFYPCPRAMADNLLNVFNAIQCADPDTFNDGLNWYNEAHSFCAITAIEHGLSLSSVAAIVAALSPAVAWEKNKEDAASLIVDPENAIVSTYGKNREKAVQIVLGADPDEILGGDKVISFYNNILYPERNDRVTIDRHAIRAAIGDFDNSSDYLVKYAYTPKRYANMANGYKLAAKQTNVLPHQLQAVAWLAVRGEEKYFWQ